MIFSGTQFLVVLFICVHFYLLQRQKSEIDLNHIILMKADQAWSHSVSDSHDSHDYDGDHCESV